jgi:hypothetical protein
MRALLVLLIATPLSLGAQGSPSPAPSPYIPLDHWAMPYIEHLITAGVIRDPSPLTRPLRQDAVMRALGALDTASVPPILRATIRRLFAEWAPRREPHYRAELSIGGAAATQAVRDPLELNRGVPEHQLDRRAFFNTGADVEVLFGPVVGVSHMVVDTRLEFDPDWYGKPNNATRFEEAYVSAQGSAGELFFGILDRNWGPAGVQGLLLSDNPYGVDHLAVTVGAHGLQLQTWAAQLDTRTDSGAPVNRYLVQNRLWIHPGRWTLALWDAGVIDGVGETFPFRYLNPATITYFRVNGSEDVNNELGLEFERRGWVTVFGQFMIDDIQVSRGSGADSIGNLKPASVAFTVGAKGRLASAAATWIAFYTQVGNLTYRNADSLQGPLYYGLGTGRNFDDYDQATVKLDLLVGPLLLLEPEVTVLRQGEGDPHLLQPPFAQYATTPVLFQGVVERIVRLALGACWTVGGTSVVANAGIHVLQNADHVTGASKSEFVGSLGVTYRFHHQDAIP